jgi:hypothetical protein
MTTNQLIENANKIHEIASNQSKIANILNDLQSNSLDTKNGISLLQIRLLELLNYSTDLILFSIGKLNGIFKQELIENLIEKRLLLEKTKPLEIKLKYQIEKLLKTRTEVDPLNYKPNPELLVQQPEQEIYKPPRLVPVRYEKEPRERVTSRVLMDLSSQYDDKPMEIDATGTGYSSREAATREDEEMKSRLLFEEENFIRLNLTRKQKKLNAKMNKQGGLIRFKNEFNDLKRDFNELSHLKDTKPIRKRSNATDLDKMTKVRRTEKGKDEFTTQKRLVKAFKKK